MSFVDPAFPVFLGVVLVVYWAARTARQQNGVLLLASYLFYGWVHPWLVGLLVFSTVLDWSLGLAMGRWPARRGPLVALSVVGNLGLLGTFKYLDFVGEVVADGAALVGVELTPWRVGLLLPAGISFFTFQTMSYTIDVYRGRLAPHRSLLEHAAFVAMFPQLVAGPIERARDLLPQLGRRRPMVLAQVGAGLTLALWGAVQKLVIADHVALWVDRAFAAADPAPVLIWSAVLGFMVQILGDFSGYSDIARGVGLMCGVRLSRNFDAPYLAASPSEFWRRWHMSFSSWMHEYVYIPLGGSKRGTARWVLAATGSLILAGLWHGAAWNFIAWGAWFAVVMVGWRLVSAWATNPLPATRRPLGVILTFTAVAVGMLIFREPDFGRALHWLGRWPLEGSEMDWVGALATLSAAAVGGGALALGGWLERRWSAASDAPWGPTVLVAGAVCLAALFVLYQDTDRAFIYFQF